jgi:hypothetical protein
VLLFTSVVKNKQNQNRSHCSDSTQDITPTHYKNLLFSTHPIFTSHSSHNESVSEEEDALKHQATPDWNAAVEVKEQSVDSDLIHERKLCRKPPKIKGGKKDLQDPKLVKIPVSQPASSTGLVNEIQSAGIQINKVKYQKSFVVKSNKDLSPDDPKRGRPPSDCD